MSPRKPAALRDDGENLRAHLIATAARLLAERGSAGLAVRDIAREAKVADGVLYNYFEDKDDLLAHALLAHVGTVMAGGAPAPRAGEGTVAGNLQAFVEGGLATLAQVAPAFAGLVSQPGVLARFHAMVGGDAAFGADMPAGAEPQERSGDRGGRGGRPDGDDPDGRGGLPDILRGYLAAEQRIGRIGASADVEAAVTLIVGTIHGEILPRVMFAPPGRQVTTPPDLPGRIVQTILAGIAPRGRRRNRGTV
jgi:AcrR family transcriptional regulator